MRVPDGLRLSKAKETAITKERVHRVSDFLTDEEKEKLAKANIKGKKKQFDKIDAYVAEIIARFGYDTYLAWQCGEIETKKMNRLLSAERVRDKARYLPLETVIISAVAGANNPADKYGHIPRSLKRAYEILKKEQEIVGGNK